MINFGNDAIIHLDKDGKPRSVEINGFEIPQLIGFTYEVAVNEIDRLSVIFYVRKAETRIDLPAIEFDGQPR